MTQADKHSFRLDEFPVPTLKQWRREVARQLGGEPAENLLRIPTQEGVTLSGMYTRADLKSLETLDTMPGDKPFVRASRSIGHRTGAWQVTQAFPYPTVEEFNRALRHDLARGQTAVNLILDEASQFGLDPDQAAVGQVGRNGTSIASVASLSRALAGIDFESTVLHVEAGIAALPLAALVVALMRTRDNDVSRWRGSCGMDPLAGLVEFGSLPIPLDWAYGELAVLTRWASENAPGLRTICVYGHPYRNAGADAVTELAAAMATAVEALRQMDSRGIPVDTAARHLLFGFTTGGDFFIEIAKLRAARLLWSRILEASGGAEASARAMFVHSRTSTYHLSNLDPYTNMLRGATEGFAAALGGTDSLHIVPYDAALTQAPSEFARRVARNTQLILIEETHAADVIDPAGGSYFVEKLTHDLAEAVWAKFQAIEAGGGMLAALKSGRLQEEIAEISRHRLAALGAREEVLVGVNRYPNPDEALALPRELDFERIHQRRSEQLQRLRTSSSHQQEMKVMVKLQEIVESDTDVKFEALVEAASNGATIGEFTSSLRHERAGGEQITPLRIRRAAEPFERLRHRVFDWQVGREPVVFLANIGPTSDYLMRLDFVRSFFEVGGFAVISGRWFENADAAIAAARRSSARAIVIVGNDEAYEQAVPLIAAAFRNKPDIGVYLAGYPEGRIEEYRAAGVDEFVHLKSDVLNVLSVLAAKMGVNR